MEDILKSILTTVLKPINEASMAVSKKIWMDSDNTEIINRINKRIQDEEAAKQARKNQTILTGDAE